MYAIDCALTRKFCNKFLEQLNYVGHVCECHVKFKLSCTIHISIRTYVRTSVKLQLHKRMVLHVWYPACFRGGRANNHTNLHVHTTHKTYMISTQVCFMRGPCIAVFPACKITLTQFYCIRGLFGGDLKLVVWQIFICSPNLNNAI